MHKLGEPYTGDTWRAAPLGTRCVNTEFPNAVLEIRMHARGYKVLAWNGTGVEPRSTRLSHSNYIQGFEPAPSWTRPLLWPDVVALPVGV